MESQPQPRSISYEIGAEGEVTRPRRLLRAFLAIVALSVTWVFVSFLMEEVAPFFRTEVPLTRAWWSRVLFTGIFWSILMVLGPFRGRRERYSLEIEPDRITKYWKKRWPTYYQDSSVIHRSDVFGVQEIRGFGRVRGLIVKSKYHPMFIPVRHPQYSEIKEKLEEWHAQS